MKTLLLLMLLTASLSAAAETWTLDQCIDYATEHNLTVKQQIVSRMQAEQSVTTAKSRYLPTVSATAGQSWNIGRGLTAENTYADRNTSTFSWNGSLNAPLFDGLNTPRQVAYAKANLQQVIEEYEAAKEDITINVISAYLQVLYCKELNDVALQQVDLSKYELTRQEALLEAGKIPEVDMLEAKSQLASDLLNATQTDNDCTMAKIDLLQLLMLDIAPEDFEVAPLADDSDMLISADEAYTLALQYNHSIIAARKGITASDKNIALAKTGYMPSLYFNLGVGSSYYKISGYPNESFGDQMKHNYSTYFGFSLSVPIFDALSTRNSVKQAKVQKINAELQLDQAEQQLFRAIQQAYYQAIGSQEKLQSSIIADEAAQAAFVAMQEKYNIGRATPTEYEQSKSKALRTTSERIQANYELILRTRLLRYYSTPH
ncbi:MAG: TolC family protein [Bacteroidales bacterium]|nr:TolC family protein [Bacteroidales bacterium]